MKEGPDGVEAADREATPGAVERLDAALETLADHPEEPVRAAAAELLAGLRLLHADALERLVDLLSEDPERFSRALADPVVANLLVLYDLVVIDERARSLEALAAAAPHLAELGVEAELQGVEEGVVSLRLSGAADDTVLGRALELVDRALVEHLPGYRGLRRPEPQGRPDGAPRSIVPLDTLRALARKQNRDREV